MGDIAYVSVGYEVDGDPALLDSVATEWWLLMKQILAQELPGVRQYIIQARGNYEGSGGTHSDGAAIDLRIYHMSRTQTLKVVAIMRQYGGVAWYRTNIGSGPHIHIAVNLKRWTECTYQVQAAKRGRDGLARNGRDPHPAPAEWITAEEGIRRMKQRLEEGIFGAMNADDAYKLIQKAVTDLAWGNEKFGAYLGRIQRNAAQAAADARQAAVNTADIRRPGDPHADAQGNKSLRQEIADVLTESRQQLAEMAKLREDLAHIAAKVEELAAK